MRRPARLVIAITAVQAMVIGVYWLVEHRRAPERTEYTSLGTEPPQRVDIAMPQVTVRKRDGSRADLRAPQRPTLVHFWATWCPPCRAELPALLTLPSQHPVDVKAVALDTDWADVDRFLDGLPVSDVLVGDAGQVERSLGVQTLPVTFLLQPGGRITLRFDGARNWTDTAFLQTWLELGPVGARPGKLTWAHLARWLFSEARSGAPQSRAYTGQTREAVHGWAAAHSMEELTPIRPEDLFTVSVGKIG